MSFTILTFSDCIKFIELDKSEHCSFCLKFDKERSLCKAIIGKRKLHTNKILTKYKELIT